MVERLSSTAQNALINIVTIFLGVTVGATANAERFLKPETLKIIGLGCGRYFTGIVRIGRCRIIPGENIIDVLFL